MENKKTLVVFFASMRTIGLLYHFRYMSEAFDKLLGKYRNITLIIVSEKGEQITGLNRELNEAIVHGDILNVTSIEQAFNYLRGKIEEFEKVIFLTQGNKQLVGACKIKLRYWRTVNIYLRLNSFNHGKKIKRTFNSLYITILALIFQVKVNFQCEYTKSIFTGSKVLKLFKRDTVIPLGLNSIKPANLADCPLDKNYINIIYLAQFHRHKNHLRILEKLKGFLEIRSNVKMNFFGDGELLNECKDYSRKLNLTEKIVFHGRIPREQIPVVIENSDVSLVASKVETFGHNILEPAWFGVPILSTDVGIAKDLFCNYRAGFTLDAELTNLGPELDNIINNLIELKEIAAKDKLVIRQKYSWDSIASNYLEQGII